MTDNMTDNMTHNLTDPGDVRVRPSDAAEPTHATPAHQRRAVYRMEQRCLAAKCIDGDHSNGLSCSSGGSLCATTVGATVRGHCSKLEVVAARGCSRLLTTVSCCVTVRVEDVCGGGAAGGLLAAPCVCSLSSASAERWSVSAIRSWF